jgi:hypothetical protein
MVNQDSKREGKEWCRWGVWGDERDGGDGKKKKEGRGQGKGPPERLKGLER